MFDPKTVSLGIAPIGWCNDDMPELGAENTFQQTVSEMALAGFTGCEIGNKYPTDPAELKKALDLRGMRIASRWYSSFILTRSMEEEEKDFIANLDFLEAVGANHINVSEQSYSIQGKVDVPILTGGHKHVMNDAEWDRFCKGLNRLGQIASERGFKLCFHHHMGTVVQTSEETDRMMSNTDPRYVFLCYDTGHFTFAGEDPLAMLKKYVDRVGHVHLKDMRLPVVEEARRTTGPSCSPSAMALSPSPVTATWTSIPCSRCSPMPAIRAGCWWRLSRIPPRPILWSTLSRAVPTSGSTPVCKSRDGRTPVLPTAFPYHFLTSNRRCFQ